jgi:hypothetical protein
MLIDGADPFATAKPNVRLIRARRFNATLVGSDGITGKNPKAFPPFPLPSSEGSALVMMRTGSFTRVESWARRRGIAALRRTRADDSSGAADAATSLHRALCL